MDKEDTLGLILQRVDNKTLWHLRHTPIWPLVLNVVKNKTFWYERLAWQSNVDLTLVKNYNVDWQKIYNLWSADKSQSDVDNLLNYCVQSVQLLSIYNTLTGSGSRPGVIPSVLRIALVNYASASVLDYLLSQGTDLNYVFLEDVTKRGLMTNNVDVVAWARKYGTSNIGYLLPHSKLQELWPTMTVDMARYLTFSTDFGSFEIARSSARVGNMPIVKMYVAESKSHMESLFQGANEGDQLEVFIYLESQEKRTSEWYKKTFESTWYGLATKITIYLWDKVRPAYGDARRILTGILSREHQHKHIDLVKFLLTKIEPNAKSLINAANNYFASALQLLLDDDRIQLSIDNLESIIISVGEKIRVSKFRARVDKDFYNVSRLNPPDLKIEECAVVLARHPKLDTNILTDKMVRYLFWGIRGHVAAKESSIANGTLLERITQDLLIRVMILKLPSALDLVAWMLAQKDSRFALAARSIVDETIPSEPDVIAYRALLLSLMHEMTYSQSVQLLESEGALNQEARILLSIWYA